MGEPSPDHGGSTAEPARGACECCGCGKGRAPPSPLHGQDGTIRRPTRPAPGATVILPPDRVEEESSAIKTTKHMRLPNNAG